MSAAERAELASRPRPDLRPRWEVERDRLNASLSPVQGWVFRQWWLYGIGAVLAAAAGLSSREPGFAVPAVAAALMARLGSDTGMTSRRAGLADGEGALASRS